MILPATRREYFNQAKQLIDQISFITTILMPLCFANDVHHENW